MKQTFTAGTSTPATNSEITQISGHRQYHIKDFHDDTAGVFSIGILHPIELAVLIDRNAGIATTMVDWLARIEETKPLCAMCDVVFTRELSPAMWLIAQSVGNRAARGVMLMGACDECCNRHSSADALIAAVAEALKRGVWPDLRVLDPIHFGAGGRA
jgi:hypothetical protein